MKNKTSNKKLNSNNKNGEEIHKRENTQNNFYNLDDLKSTYYQLEHLNLQLENCFSKQKESAEKNFYEKVHDIIKLREYNFNLSSKLNNMSNITQIEDYLSMTYNKINSTEPKITNVIEVIDDLKTNVNYSLDRLHLEDYFACDEMLLEKHLEISAGSLEKLEEENNEKFNQIEEVKTNYEILLQLIEDEKAKIFQLKELIEGYKVRSLDKKIQELNTILENENNDILYELINN